MPSQLNTNYRLVRPRSPFPVHTTREDAANTTNPGNAQLPQCETCLAFFDPIFYYSFFFFTPKFFFFVFYEKRVPLPTIAKAITFCGNPRPQQTLPALVQISVAPHSIRWRYSDVTTRCDVTRCDVTLSVYWRSARTRHPITRVVSTKWGPSTWLGGLLERVHFRAKFSGETSPRSFGPKVLLVKNATKCYPAFTA